MAKWFIFLAFWTSANASDFCEGFKVGYGEGYCYQEFACLKPLTPLCPLANLGERGFQDGYNRGFMAGQAERPRPASPYSAPDSPRRSTTYSDRMNQSMQDAGASIAQAGAAIQASRAAEESSKLSKARFRAEMTEKAVEFDQAYPGEDNPYRSELQRLDREEAEKKRQEAEAAESAKSVWILLGVALGVLFLAAAASGT